jgi:uncharacterized protein (DUF2062 family)
LHWLQSAHRARDPHHAALSFGLGAFLGFLPIGALATVVAALAPRRLGLPTPPAVAGTFAGNWLTAPFIYAASVWTGSILTSGRPPRWIPLPQAHWTEHFFSVLRYGPSFLLGILVVSVVAGAAGYGFMRLAIPLARRVRRRLRGVAAARQTRSADRSEGSILR